MGFLNKITGGFFKGKAPSVGVSDVRSPGERAVDERMMQEYLRLLNQPDYGFQEDEKAQDPYYARMLDRMNQGIEGSYASRGFGSLRTGPAAYQAGQAAQTVNEGRLANTVSRRDAWKRMALGFGSNPQGRTAYSIPGRKSAFSSIAGPFLGAAGYGLGGPAGAAIGSGIGGLFGGQTNTDPYQSLSDEVRSR